MAFIKCLSEPESVFRGKRGLTLERGEIVKLRRDVFGRVFLFFYLAFFADAALANGHGFFLIPEALRSAVWMLGVFLPVEVDPFAGVVALSHGKVGVDLPVVFGLEGLDLTLTFG